MDVVRRAYMDMLAYGRHLESCTKGRVILPGGRGRAPIREKRCSCGLDAALDLLERRGDGGSGE